MADQFVVNSPLSAVDVPKDLNLYQFFCGNLDQYGDKPAITEVPSGHTITYRELKEQIHRLGSALKRAGFSKGDVFTIYSPNLAYYPVVVFAVAAIGGVVAAINPLYTTEELIPLMKITDSKYLVAYTFNANNAKHAGEELNLKGLYVFGEKEGMTPFSKLLEDDGSLFEVDTTIKPMEDTVVVPYSSGTTGIPKGVMLTHYSLAANSLQILHPEIALFGNDAAVLGLLPWYHIYGMVVVLFTGIRIGAHLISFIRFEPEVFLQAIEKYKIKYACLVPPLYVFLAKHPSVEKYDLSSLEETVCGAAPLDSNLSQAVKKRANITLLRQVYGMTELSPVSHTVKIADADTKYGAIGVCVPNTKAKIVDIESGESLPAYKTGELCIDGPQKMKGYFGNPQATANTIDSDGWLHTGDIGYFDEEGYVFIVDRLKELIKYKGSQVPPAELEALLLTNDKVADVAVIGRPDEEAGELPTAFIVKRSDITEDEIIAFVKDRVGPHKRLRGGVEFIDKIPKSASGKILRQELRQRLKDSMTKK